MYLELRHLRTMLALAETGSLSAAARRLHLTQSALSHQLRGLETYFDTPLVRRGTRPLRLSAAGEQLLALARQVLPRVDQAEHTLKAGDGLGAGRLFVTLECHACYDWLLPLLDRFRRAWPQVEMDLLSARFEALPDLLSGEVDLVITADPSGHRSLEFFPLFDYQARLVMAADHPLARLKRIQPHHLQDQVLLSYPVPRHRLDVFRRFLEPAGVAPREVRQVELTAMLLQLVASRRGVAALPDWVVASSAAPEGLVTRPLGRRGLKGRMYAAVRGADVQLPWVGDFVSLATGNTVAEAPGGRGRP